MFGGAIAKSVKDWVEPNVFRLDPAQRGSSGDYNKQIAANNAYLKQIDSQDPKKVRYTVNGVNYNFAGQPIKSPGNTRQPNTVYCNIQDQFNQRVLV